MTNGIGPDAWFSRCRSNIRAFQKDRSKMTRDQQVEFIRDQYAILSVIQKVIHGNTRLQGLSRS